MWQFTTEALIKLCRFQSLILQQPQVSYRLRTPTPAVGFSEAQIFNVNFIHYFGIFLLDLEVNQAILLLFLLGEEWTNSKVAKQGQHTQERQ